MTAGKYIVAVDLGGTKICAGICATDGRIVGKIIKKPTEFEKPRNVILDNIIRAIEQAVNKTGIQKNKILGIGIGSPGPLDAKKGIILTPPNLPTLHGLNLKKAIEKRFQLPVCINNDGNVFALGESYFGVARNANIVYGITLGTGLGSGLVMEKKLYNGATGTAAETGKIAHQAGIIEDYVCGRGIENIYRKKSGITLKPAEIAERARKGDKNAISAWREFGYHLGIVMSHVVNIVDPDMIVVGGSISSQYDLFVKEFAQTLRGHIYPGPRKHVRIRKSKLGENAALLGAASLVLDNSNR